LKTHQNKKIIAFSFSKGIEMLTVDKLLEYEEPAGQGKIF